MHKLTPCTQHENGGQPANFITSPHVCLISTVRVCKLHGTPSSNIEYCVITNFHEPVLV